jgi:hypothetical protein
VAGPCTAAVLAALLAFVAAKNGTTFAPGSLIVRARSLGGRLAMDAATLAHLEVLRNGRTGGEAGSLLGALDATRTAGGARLLRATLALPHAHAPTLVLRLEAVAELAGGGAAASGAAARTPAPLACSASRFCLRGLPLRVRSRTSAPTPPPSRSPLRARGRRALLPPGLPTAIT